MLCLLWGSLVLGAEISKNRAPKMCFLSKVVVDRSLSLSTFKLMVEENDPLNGGA